MSTVASNYGAGGAAFIRDVLWFTDYTSGGAKPKSPPPVEARAIVVNQTTPTQVVNIPLQNWGDTIDQVSESIESLETELHDVGVKDVGIETDIKLQGNLSDLEIAHQFIGTMSGQVKASAVKISVFDKQITQLTKERDRIAFSREDGVQIDEARITEINEELKEFKE